MKVRDLPGPIQFIPDAVEKGLVGKDDTKKKLLLRILKKAIIETTRHWQDRTAQYGRQIETMLEELGDQERRIASLLEHSDCRCEGCENERKRVESGASTTPWPLQEEEYSVLLSLRKASRDVGA